MTPDQTKMILAKAALIDNRTVDIHVIRAWHEIIGHLDYGDALEALNLHRLESTEYLVPAHIKNNMFRAKAMRKAAEAKERAIEVARAHQILEKRGEEATPVRMQELEAELNNFGSMDRTPLNLYERLKNSPEGRNGFPKSA